MRSDPVPLCFFLWGRHTWRGRFLKLPPYHSSFRFQVKHICIFNTRTFLLPLLHLLIYNCWIWGGKKHFCFADWPVGFSEAASENAAVGGPGNFLAEQPPHVPGLSM